MQTFLPFPDFSLTACCLDNQTLGKQRIEALTIYNVLKEHKTNWNKDFACRMWYGYPSALAWYHNVIASTLNSRKLADRVEMLNTGFPIIFPPWLGNWKLHRSHQSKLLKKDENHYRLWFGPNVPKNLELVWPAR